MRPSFFNMKSFLLSQKNCLTLVAITLTVVGISQSPIRAAESTKPVEAVPQAKKKGPLPSPETEPTVITAGQNGSAPSDAIVLFNGKDLSNWESMQGEPTKWKVEDGAMISVKGAGYIRTKAGFGDCQLHVEWATPTEVVGEGQGRGNSGVFFQGIYELQVLDSYNNKTYFHGQAASIYKQHAPLVNASRKPGEWQTYDVVFHTPKFKGEKLVRPATVTVLHNGVLTQDHVEIFGATSHDKAPVYTAHDEKLPLAFQDHGNPVRYRNIWLRPLPEHHEMTLKEYSKLPAE